MKNSDINELIKQTSSEIQQKQFELAKLKHLQAIYPDIKYFRGIFSTKQVNENYDEVLIESTYSGLELKAYKKIEFKYGELITETKVFSSPYINKIAVISYEYDYVKHTSKSKIKFTRYCQTFKSKKFDSIVLKKVRESTIQFLDQHKNYIIDDTNLDPKLKKILLFS